MTGARKLFAAGLVGLMLLVGGFGGWALLTEISGAVIAAGRLVATQDDQVVQHPEGGVVAEIRAREGALVSAGQTLVRLDDKILSAELAATRYRLAALHARIARLEAEQADAQDVDFSALSPLAGAGAFEEHRANQREVFAARRAARAAEQDRLTQQESQTSARLQGLREQRGALTRQIKLVEAELHDQESLASRGLATEVRLNTLRREHAQLTGQKGEIEAGIAEAEAGFMQMQTEHLRGQIALREETARALEASRLERAALLERLATLEARAYRLDIRAPISGRVHDLRLHAIGAVLRGADPVARIVSDEAAARILGRVAPVHVDELHPGQAARLRFPALNARTTPEVSGRLLRVSADTLQDQASGETYYEVEIEITKEGLSVLGAALVPGMPVEAYIHTEPRSPMSYLLRPLGDYFARAFRET